jgi:hypothetical protein
MDGLVFKPQAPQTGKKFRFLSEPNGPKSLKIESADDKNGIKFENDRGLHVEVVNPERFHYFATHPKDVYTLLERKIMYFPKKNKMCIQYSVGEVPHLHVTVYDGPIEKRAETTF